MISSFSTGERALVKISGAQERYYFEENEPNTCLMDRLFGTRILSRKKQSNAKIGQNSSYPGSVAVGAGNWSPGGSCPFNWFLITLPAISCHIWQRQRNDKFIAPACHVLLTVQYFLPRSSTCRRISGRVNRDCDTTVTKTGQLKMHCDRYKERARVSKWDVPWDMKNEGKRSGRIKIFEATCNDTQIGFEVNSRLKMHLYQTRNWN